MGFQRGSHGPLFLSRSFQFDLLDQESLHESQENTLMIEDKCHPRQYYKFWVLPGHWMRGAPAFT